MGYMHADTSADVSEWVGTACLRLALACLLLHRVMYGMQPIVWGAHLNPIPAAARDVSCLLSAVCYFRQSANELQEAAGADSREHRQCCKQLAAALCSLAEKKVELAEDVAAVSETEGCVLAVCGSCGSGGQGQCRWSSSCSRPAGSRSSCNPTRQCE